MACIIKVAALLGVLLSYDGGVFGLKLTVTYACGTMDAKKITVYVVANDITSEKQKIVETVPLVYNASATPCRSVGVAQPDKKLILQIPEADFQRCGVIPNPSGKEADVNMTVYRNASIFTSDNTVSFSLKCDFTNQRIQNVPFGIMTYTDCGRGSFFCSAKRKCMNARYRCVGNLNVKERCIDGNSEETGCSANNDGSYNVMEYIENNKAQFEEYRGFAYHLKDNLATEDDINGPYKTRYDNLRPRYTRIGTSMCSYETIGEYNTWFNEISVENRLNCLDYMKGVKKILLDSYSKYDDLRRKSGSSNEEKTAKFLWDLTVKDDKGTSTCTFESTDGSSASVSERMSIVQYVLVVFGALALHNRQ